MARKKRKLNIPFVAWMRQKRRKERLLLESIPTEDLLALFKDGVDTIGQSTRPNQLRQCGYINGNDIYVTGITPTTLVGASVFTIMFYLHPVAPTDWRTAMSFGDGYLRLDKYGVAGQHVFADTGVFSGTKTIDTPEYTVTKITITADGTTAEILVNDIVVHSEAQAGPINVSNDIFIGRRAAGFASWTGHLYGLTIDVGSSGDNDLDLQYPVLLNDVATWFDLSGNDLHAVQSGGTSAAHISSRLEFGSDTLEIDGWNYGGNLLLDSDDASGAEWTYYGGAPTITNIGEYQRIEQASANTMFFFNNSAEGHTGTGPLALRIRFNHVSGAHNAYRVRALDNTDTEIAAYDFVAQDGVNTYSFPLTPTGLGVRVQLRNMYNYGLSADQRTIDFYNVDLQEELDTTLFSTGDSICAAPYDMDAYQINSYTARFADANGIGYINTGVGGSKLDEIDSRFATDIGTLTPTVFFLEGGANDIFQEESDPTALMISSMTSLIAKSLAYTTSDNIYVFGIPDIGLDQADRIEYRETYNTWAKSYCASNGYTYIDTSTPLGNHNPDYYEDGDDVHPNSKGHLAIFNYINSRVLVIPSVGHVTTTGAAVYPSLIIPPQNSGIVDALGSSLLFSGRAKYSLDDSGSFPQTGELYDVDQLMGGDVFYDSTDSFTPFIRTDQEWFDLTASNNASDGLFGVGPAPDGKRYVYSSAQSAEDYAKAQKYIGND